MKVDVQTSFACFVYPFLFEPETFQARVAALSSAKWQDRFVVWTQAHFPRDDLLAHVERYLNPPEGMPPTAYLWEMSSDVFHSPAGLGANAQWQISLPKRQIPFSLDSLHLAMFRVGTGFATAAVSIPSEDMGSWLDLLHYFRFVRGQRGVGVLAQRRVGRNDMEPFFPEPAGGRQKHPEGRGVFGEVLEATLRTASLKEDDDAPWWTEVFVPGQLIPFAALFLDGEDVSTQPIGEWLYRVRNFFPLEPEIVPAAEDIQVDHPSLLAYARQQWFVFSLEGGDFVAVNAPQNEFFRQTLPERLRGQYFLLFLMALHQRFALTRLSLEVSEHWLRGSERERIQAFERIRDALLDFTARGYFTQVMQRQLHHRIYRKWQEAFQVKELYEEVSEEVRDMHEHLLAERTARLEEKLNLFGTLIGVPALVMSFLSINLYGITAEREGLPFWLALMISAISLGFGGLFWLLLSRRA